MKKEVETLHTNTLGAACVHFFLESVKPSLQILECCCFLVSPLLNCLVNRLLRCLQHGSVGVFTLVPRLGS